MNGESVLRELYVEKIVAGGDGLCRPSSAHDGLGPVTFVPFVLQGERIEADCPGPAGRGRTPDLQRELERRGQIESQGRSGHHRQPERRSPRSGFDRGELRRVLDPSPERIEPPCPYFGRCGGCDLQHMSYPEQLRRKVEMVLDAFHRTGRLELASLSIVPSEPFGYRNRVQFHRSRKGEIGFMERQSNRVVPIERCLIAVPEINRLLSSESSGTLLGNGADRFTVFAWGGSHAVEGDGETIRVQLLGQEIELSAESFAQSNVSMLNRLIPWVRRQVQGSRIVDLYAGAGLFSIFLSESTTELHVVESDDGAAALARKNMAGSSGGHVEVHAERVESWLKRVGRKIRPDTVIVDPPRQGLSAEVRRLFPRMAPSRIVYVSCDPVTLARDCGELVGNGFGLNSLLLFDFYPQTAHIEAVATLDWTGRS